MKSPIKYFGGKNGMAYKILDYFPKNYTELTYLEPFCGSAAMLFHKEASPIEVINDLNKNVYSLFKVLSDKKLYKSFKEKCDLTLFSEDIRTEFRLDLKKKNLDVEERAYKFFILNRCSVNGVGGFSTGEVIRRKMSKSVSDYLSAIDGLFEVHNRLSKVIIHNRDGIDLIEKWDRANAFMYLDPPYALETRSSGGYDVDMDNDDQNRLLNTLINIKNAKVLVSGYNCDRYSILEDNGYKRIDIEIKTQTGQRKPKTKIESLWKNY